MSGIFQIVVGNTGSTGSIAEEIGKIAISRGWESYIASARYSRPSKSVKVQIGSWLDVLIHVIWSRLFDSTGLGSVNATNKLVKKIDEIRPDVIHLHHIHGYFINYKILFNYLSQSNIPVTWTFHDCWSITGHCCHFDFVGCNKWQNECNRCPQINEYPASYFVDNSKRNFNLKKKYFLSVKNLNIVAVSHWMDRTVGNSFLKNASRKVIYNGVDLSVFKPIVGDIGFRKKNNISNRYMILGVASPWSPRKGLNEFIDLSKEIDENKVIVLVGLNEKQIDTLPENIIGLGRTESQKELADLYSTADLFINLSTEESFGLTTAEALACGTPVIVLNSTASPELVDTETGIVVEKNDLKGLINAILEISFNGKQFYSLACRNRAERLFNQDVNYKEYMKLFEILKYSNTQITK
jgi:putative colanic acid biosynthesis glycosyltransferase